jgi:diamine N-acetyltransferase
MPTVSLREITSDTVNQVCRLEVRPEQAPFVAPNAVSLAEALFAPEAWYRAIYLDDLIVGFVMLWDDTLGNSPPAKPEICLLRLMVAADHQGQGVGKRAIAQVVRYVQSRPGINRFYSSYVVGEAGPELFYRSLGFAPTGAVDDDGEAIIEYPLATGAAGLAQTSGEAPGNPSISGERVGRLVGQRAAEQLIPVTRC